MESLQTQVSMLSHKLDALYQIIEDLSNKISEVVSERRLAASHNGMSQVGFSVGRYHHPNHNALDTLLEHKDVLVDTKRHEIKGHSAEQELTPEIQIQRLTAQLTAAYNRIAALEEQLLSHRIH
jgi:hypothetical protein